MERHRGEGMTLTAKEKDILLDIVKKTVRCKLDGKEPDDFYIEAEALKEKTGVFVTFRKHGRLRGCIGCIEARTALHRTVEEMAAAAAFNDPRFSPLQRDELEYLTVEISVLSAFKAIKDVEEIEVGRNGLYVVKGYRSGLLLPQVATEYKWDRLTFLEETCYKANLLADAWKEKDTKIYTFSADVFSQPWQV
jgi:AmmeMemoRadiSam system protein A